MGLHNKLVCSLRVVVVLAGVFPCMVLVPCVHCQKRLKIAGKMELHTTVLELESNQKEFKSDNYLGRKYSSYSPLGSFFVILKPAIQQPCD